MKLNLKELVAFAMLGVILFLSKLLMASLPNIHLLAMFTIAITLVFRKKALYPIYVYVGLEFLVYGFSPYMVPYLYLWTLLWGATMLLPKTMKKSTKMVVCIGLCAAHGFLYGLLYVPGLALVTGMNWQSMVAWFLSGIPFDITHGIGNLFAGFLILPVEQGLYIAKKYCK